MFVRHQIWCFLLLAWLPSNKKMDLSNQPTKTQHQPCLPAPTWPPILDQLSRWTMREGGFFLQRERVKVAQLLGGWKEEHHLEELGVFTKICCLLRQWHPPYGECWFNSTVMTKFKVFLAMEFCGWWLWVCEFLDEWCHCATVKRHINRKKKMLQSLLGFALSQDVEIFLLVIFRSFGEVGPDHQRTQPLQKLWSKITHVWI